MLRKNLHMLRTKTLYYCSNGKQQAGFPVAEAVMLIDAMMETLMMVMNTSIMLKIYRKRGLWLLGGKQQAGFPVAEAVMLIDAMMETLMMVMDTSIMRKIYRKQFVW